jgi:glycopeptide antibiotics resistance protein
VALFVVYLGLLAGVALFKLPFPFGLTDGVRVVNWRPFQGVASGNPVIWREMAGNVALFVPFGVYLAALTPWRWPARIGLMAAVSAALELTQYVFALGRTDITDVIDNTLGGLLGLALYGVTARAWPAKAGRAVNLVAAPVTLVTLAAFAYLLWLGRHHLGLPPLAPRAPRASP